MDKADAYPLRAAKPVPPNVSRVDEIDRRAEALRENLKKRKMQSKNKAPEKQAPEDKEQ